MENKYSVYNAEVILKKLEEKIATGRKLRVEDVCEELNIFDWWTDELSQSKMKQMKQFLKEAIKLGFTGYVCFKVGATGCSNGMWAFVKESNNGYSPKKCKAIYRSFTPSYTYWDILDDEGNLSGEELESIKQLEAYISNK